MVKTFVFIFIFLTYNSFGQNPVFRLMDSISSIADTNYYLGKKALINLEHKYTVDPAEKLLFLVQSLKNKDIKYFKKSIHKLIINNGFRYSKDNHELYNRYSHITKYLIENGLEEWLLNESAKNYYKWVKNNPKAFEVRCQMENLLEVDQTRTYFYEMWSNKLLDSAEIAQELRKFDNDNLNNLIKITNSIGILPNHFDHGIGTYYLWQISFYHNFYPETIIEVWNKMLPYIEDAYFSGKIGSGLFQLYDFQLNMLFGYQYYGFLKNVPVKDAEGLENRRKKYGFI